MAIKAENGKILKETLSIIYTIIAALLIRIFIIELFFVPSGSMQETILKNDYIFATKYSYGYSNYSIPFSPDILKHRILSSKPERGDVIIFRPPHDMEIRYIKRLIGLPGDKIQLKDNVIYINDIPIKRDKIGIVLDEENQQYVKYKETLPNGTSYYSYELENIMPRHGVSDTAEFFVPDDMYFFLGDNRYNSNDSRFELGYVPFKNFVAKAQFIFFSTEKTLFNFQSENWGFHPYDWISSIRFSRIFSNLYNL